MTLKDGHLIATINEKTREVVSNVSIENGHLMVKKNIAPIGRDKVTEIQITEGRLSIGEEMAKKDLGQVIPNIEVAQGSHFNSAGTATVTASSSGGTTTFTFDYMKGTKGDKGNTGDTGPQGPTGPKGDNGITPSLSIENGHLYADYDNPITPS